ncbi:MAG: hypothetical protein H0X17_11070 [Deltaproteobacteria bacterium]|nr:hypothetical protein [Deltaproteobacteria bacterium]
MRPSFSRGSDPVFDLLLGAAFAWVLIGSAGEVAQPPAVADDVQAARSQQGPTLESAYEPMPPALEPARVERPLDPATAELQALVVRGRHWRVETPRGPVHVWAPEGYDPVTATTVVYVHGYHADADTVWRTHRLPEQFALSGVNALFVVPEAPTGKHDAIAWSSPAALLRTIKGELDVSLPAGRLAAIGHSGAYRTIIQWLGDARLDTVVLLDAAYVDVWPYRTWVVAARKRRLINVSIDTIRWSDRLHRTLPSTVTVDGFPREITDGLRAARILYIRSDIGHWPLVTEGVALPAMVRALHATRVLDVEPPLGLPPGPERSALAERQAE